MTTVQAAGLAAAALLSIAFAGVGDAILGRRSASLQQWNASFLIGNGAAAAATYPLGLLLGRRTLDAILTLVALTAVATLFRSRRVPAAIVCRSIPRRLSARLWLALALVAFVIFVGLNLRSTYLWDGLTIWAAKGYVLYCRGFLDNTFPPEPFLFRRILNYPPLVPLNEALVGRILGSFRLSAVKGIFPVFFFSLLASTYTGSRRVTGRIAALAAVAIIATIPAVSLGTNLGGYSEIPLAACTTAAAAAALRPRSIRGGWRAEEPWLLGVALYVKEEAIFPVALAVLIALALLLRSKESKPAASFFTPLALMAGIRIVHVVQIGVPNPAYSFVNPLAMGTYAQRVPVILARAAREFCNLGFWGLLWPTFVVAGILACVVIRKPKLNVLFAVTAAWIVLTLMPFFLSELSLSEHLDIALGRLLEPPAALAVIGVTAVYTQISRRISAT